MAHYRYDRRRSIKTLDEELFNSGILFLTGGQDKYGHRLASLQSQDVLHTRYTAAHLVLLIRFYYTLTEGSTERWGLAFLVNLHTWSKDSIRVLVEALDAAQEEHRGTVAVVYAIQPKSRDASKLFKKLTGLKSSKTNPKPRIYETVVVATPGELLRYMEIKQLTEDFGGSLKYNHRAWVRFMKTIDELEDNINKCLDKLPEAHDKLSMMCEYDIPVNQTDAELLLSNIRTRYQDIMRDLNLEHMIDECKGILEKLAAPSRSAEYDEIRHTPSYRSASSNIVQYERQLIRSREEMKGTWQQAETRIVLISKLSKYKAKAQKILDWLEEVGLPSVKAATEVADCLSKAEIHKTQYETGFLSIAKNVIWLADKVQNKLDEALLETKASVSYLVPFTRHFRNSMEYFRKLTRDKHTVYLNIYHFYLSAHQTPLAGVRTNPSQTMHTYLQQLTKWYRRSLNFLPVEALRQQPVITGDNQDMVFHGSSEWGPSVEHFLVHHPAPKAQHLQKIQNILPVIDNLTIRNQARLLLHRVSVLCALMSDPSTMSSRDMQAVLRWRNQLLDGYDDITLHLANSGIDQISLGDALSASNRKSPQPLGSKVATKLKGSLLQTADNSKKFFSLDRRHMNPKPMLQRHQSIPDNIGSVSVPPLDLSFVDHSTSLESGPASRQPSVERYVTLGYMENTDASVLPASIQNLNLDALKYNQPQRPRSAFLHPHGSIADSGIAHTRSDDFNKSGLSLNVMGLESPRSQMLDRNSSRSMPNLEEISPTQSQMPRFVTINLDTVANSDLNPEEKLDLMTRICGGDGKIYLSPEQQYKLAPDRTVLSNIQKYNKPTLSSQKHHPTYSTLADAENAPPIHHGDQRNLNHSGEYSRRESELESKVKKLRARPLSAIQAPTWQHLREWDPGQEQHQYPDLQQQTEANDPIFLNRDSGYSDRYNISESRPYVRWEYPEEYSGRTSLTLPRSFHSSLGSSSHLPAQHIVNESHHRLSHPGTNSYTPVQTFPRQNQNTSQASEPKQNPNRFSPTETEIKHRPHRRRKPSKKSSIKVEEWMERQGQQFKRDGPGHSEVPLKMQDKKRSGSMGNQSDSNNRKEDARLTATRSDPVGLTTPRGDPSSLTVSGSVLMASSLTESAEGESDCASRLLAEIALDEAELDQEDVADSLHTTARILQEEEDDMLAGDYSLPPSPTSTHSSLPLHEPIIPSIQASQQQSCPLGSDRSISSHLATDQDTPERHQEGSLSEESGVYTQMSGDSRFRFTDPPSDSLHIYQLSYNRYLGQNGVLFEGSSMPEIHLEDTSQFRSVPDAQNLSECTYTNSSFIPESLIPNGHLSVSKEPSFGDSSSQTTVLTEIQKHQLLSSSPSDSSVGSGSKLQKNEKKSLHQTVSVTSSHNADRGNVEHEEGYTRPGRGGGFTESSDC